MRAAVAENTRARATEQAGWSRASSAPPRGWLSSRPRSRRRPRPRSASCSTAATGASPRSASRRSRWSARRALTSPASSLLRGPARRDWRETLAAVAAVGGKAKLRCGGKAVPTSRRWRRSSSRPATRLAGRRRPGSITRSARSTSTASSTSSRPPSARGGGGRGRAALHPRGARPGRARRAVGRRPRALRLDRLVLVRRARRGPPGAGRPVSRPLGVFSPPGGAPRVGAATATACSTSPRSGRRCCPPPR